MSADPLELIAAEIRKCTACKLCESRKNPVPGEGNGAAKILFVGEAPGKTENEKGRPFVGSAGKILDVALEKAGIYRSSVFITNAVKCRPPGNRQPDAHEISTCFGFLERQISIINPAIICILGRTALSSVLGPEYLSARRGTIVEKGGRKYFISLHPAAAIYNRKLLTLFEHDLKALASELGLASPRSKENMEDYL